MHPAGIFSQIAPVISFAQLQKIIKFGPRLLSQQKICKFIFDQLSKEISSILFLMIWQSLSSIGRVWISVSKENLTFCRVAWPASLAWASPRPGLAQAGLAGQGAEIISSPAKSADKGFQAQETSARLHK